MAEGTLFVQRQLYVSPPMTLAKLREIIKDLPDDAEVDIIDGEGLQFAWQRNE